jgi:hypothetical protein
MPGYEEDEVIKGMRKWYSHSLTHHVNRSEARRLNKGELESCGFGRYSIGDECSRFFSREALIEQARKQLKDIVPHAEVLLACDQCDCGVCEVLVGPPKLVRLGNQLWKADEKEGYDWTDKRESIDKQWQRLFRNLGFLA